MAHYAGHHPTPAEGFGEAFLSFRQKKGLLIIRLILKSTLLNIGTLKSVYDIQSFPPLNYVE